jgi:hypothetical protein
MTIETKYNIGDEVWAMLLGDPEHCKIESVKSYRSRTHRFVEYYLTPIHSSWGFHAKEYEVFSTKEELLKSL